MEIESTERKDQMQERKRKKLLRAAVALSLLGAMAIPSEIEAIMPDQWWDSPTFSENTYNYDARFNWTWDRNYGSVCGITLDSDTQNKSGIKLVLHGSFYAFNIDNPSKKEITHFTNFRTKNLTLIGYGDWKSDGKTATRVFTRDEMSQNGAKLRNVQEHVVSTMLEEKWFYDTVTDCYVYYTVNDVSNSYLSFEDSGITWNNGGTLFTLDHKFDFGTNGLSADLDSLNITNAGDVKIGDSMALINAGSYYDYSTFYNKVSPSLYKTKSFDFGNMKLKNSVTASGKVNVQTGISNSNGNLALTLDAKSYTLKTLDVDLSKIGNGEGMDPWTPGGSLYQSANREASNPLTISI